MTSRRKGLYTLLFLGGIVAPAQGAVVTGYVCDLDKGTEIKTCGVPGVSVKIQDPMNSKPIVKGTDADGRFRIEGSWDPGAAVCAEKVGYIPRPCLPRSVKNSEMPIFLVAESQDSRTSARHIGRLEEKLSDSERVQLAETLAALPKAYRLKLRTELATVCSQDFLSKLDRAEAWREKTVTVGGAPMYPSKNIVENAANSKDHTTLVAAVKAAGLVETLSSKGPFTVFLPDNSAFAKLPAYTVDSLLKPDMKNQLVKVLTYHVVPGKLRAEDITKQVKASNNKLSLKTVEGANLILSLDVDGKVFLTDESGNQSRITTGELNQSNGVVYGVDTVLLPK